MSGIWTSEEMTLITDAVAIDFSSLLRGKLALVQPTQATPKLSVSPPTPSLLVNQVLTCISALTGSVASASGS